MADAKDVLQALLETSSDEGLPKWLLKGLCQSISLLNGGRNVVLSRSCSYVSSSSTHGGATATMPIDYLQQQHSWERDNHSRNRMMNRNINGQGQTCTAGTLLNKKMEERKPDQLQRLESLVLTTTATSKHSDDLLAVDSDEENKNCGDGAPGDFSVKGKQNEKTNNIICRPFIPKLGLDKHNVGRGSWLGGEQTQGDTYVRV